MKLNKKGFLLAETIVTVCIIAALATSMYIYISRTASRFEDRDNYENVIDVYKTNTVKKYLKNKGYLVNTYATGVIDQTRLGVLKDELNINNVYLIPDTIDGKNLITDSNQALKDYLNWVSIDGDDSDLRLIIWFNGKDGEDGTFANLKITE